jgi:hypothetical protein
MKEVSALKFDPDLSIFHDDDNSVSSLQFDLNEPNAEILESGIDKSYRPTPISVVRRKAFISLLVGPGETDEVSKLLFPEHERCLIAMSSNTNVKNIKDTSSPSEYENSLKVTLGNTSYEVESMNKVMENLLISAEPLPQDSENLSTTLHDQFGDLVPDSKNQKSNDHSYFIPNLEASTDSESMKYDIEDDKSTHSSIIHKNSPKCSKSRRKLWARSHPKKTTKDNSTNGYKGDDKSLVSTSSNWSSKLANIFRPKLFSKGKSKIVHSTHRLNHIREQKSYDDDDSIVTSAQIQSELIATKGRGVIENLHRLQQQPSFRTSSTFMSDLDPSCSDSFVSASSESNLRVQVDRYKSSYLKDCRSCSLILPVQKPPTLEHLNRSLSDPVDYKSRSSNKISPQVKQRVQEKLTKRGKKFKLFHQSDDKSSKSEYTDQRKKNDEKSHLMRERLLSDSSNDTSYPIIHMSSFSNRNNKIFDTPGKSLSSINSRSPSNSKMPSKQGASHTRTKSDPTMLSPSPYAKHQRLAHKRMGSLPISFSNEDYSIHKNRECNHQVYPTMHRTHRRIDSLSSVSSDISCLSDSISVASSYVSYHDPCAKPSKIVKRSRLVLGAGDGDIWYEKIFVSIRTGKRRTFFVSLATGRKKSDEPPTGASKVLYLEDLEDMKEMNLPVPSLPLPPHLKRYSSC